MKHKGEPIERPPTSAHLPITPSIRLSSADDGGLEVWVTQRDEETGKFVTSQIKLPGRSIVTTTTKVEFDPQDATRTWMHSIDASPE